MPKQRKPQSTHHTNRRQSTTLECDLQTSISDFVSRVELYIDSCRHFHVKVKKALNIKATFQAVTAEITLEVLVCECLKKLDSKSIVAKEIIGQLPSGISKPC